jgi:hypothetical protein
LHPLNYALGLAKAAEQAGVMILQVLGHNWEDANAFPLYPKNPHL